LLAEVEVDAVALTGPNCTHKPIAIAVARAGKHVFCEKMMALTVPDCWEMVHACDAANVRRWSWFGQQDQVSLDQVKRQELLESSPPFIISIRGSVKAKG
jgi:UDP-N-acetyl-2-amino-2-deoxyglucuronate dehydrogenase